MAEMKSLTLNDVKYDSFVDPVARALAEASAVIKSVSGENISVSDASEGKPYSFSLYGKTTQNGIPSLDNHVELVTSGEGGRINLTVGNKTGAKNIGVNTPNGLLGFPVISGGNYIDSNGKEWVSDELNLITGLYTKMVTEVVYDGDENWVFFGEYNGLYRYYCLVTDAVSTGVTTDQRIISNTLPTLSVTSWTAVTSQGIALHPSDRIVNVFVPFATVDEWTAYLAENPMTIVYQLAEPIITRISEDELADYSTLHTYRDLTTITNDAGAGLGLEYVIDIRKYIDAQISGAILEATVE